MHADRRSDPRRGIAARVGLTLAATGIMSSALDRRALAGAVLDVPIAIAFGLALALLFLATFRRPVAGVAWIALGAAAVVLLLAAGELGGIAGTVLYLAIATVAVIRTAPHLRPFTAAAFALWTPALWIFGPANTTELLSAPLRIAAMAALAFTVFALVDPRRVHPSDRLRRSGYGMLAIGIVSACAARTLTVAPRFSITDVFAIATVIALPLLAYLRVRPAARELAVATIALVTYASVGLSYIVGTPYHADAVVAPHHAAELLLQGREPYAAYDLTDALARFGLDPQLATHLVDGGVLHTYAYPALSFLVVTPFVGAGLDDIRWIYLAEILVLALLVSARLRPSWRPFALATVVGNEVIARQSVLAGIDPTWALLLVLSWIGRDRRWLSPLLLGLAIADRQPAWFAAPFVLVAAAEAYGRSEAVRRAAIAIAVAVLVQAPFLVLSPVRTVTSVLGPLVAPLVADGVGLMQLGVTTRYTTLLPREAYTLLAVIVLVLLLVMLWRRPRELASAPLVWPFIPLYFAWRSLQNYFAFVGPFAMVADDELAPETEVSRAGPEDASRRT